MYAYVNGQRYRPMYSMIRQMCGGCHTSQIGDICGNCKGPIVPAQLENIQVQVINI